MRHVAPVRVERHAHAVQRHRARRTAGVKRQLLGVFSESLLEPLVEVLRSLGSERVWAVNGADGLDELTTTGPSHVLALEGGKIRRFSVTPQDAGLSTARLEDLKGGDPEHNAAALKRVLDGEKGPYRDIAVLNAAASLVVAGKAETLRQGAALAQAALDEGAARATLARLLAASNAAAAEWPGHERAGMSRYPCPHRGHWRREIARPVNCCRRPRSNAGR
jgi:anthranilate phosphoribosyltransferase